MKHSLRPQANNSDYSESTAGVDYMPIVMDTTACTRHKAARGMACYTLVSMDDKFISAICNSRAIKAGYNHQISPEALRTGFKKRKFFSKGK